MHGYEVTLSIGTLGRNWLQVATVDATLALDIRVIANDGWGRFASVEISSKTVRRLIREQFPQWAELPVTSMVEQANDNRTFRLGHELAVRLPSAESYVAGIAKEDRCLPLLARHLNTQVPVPVATGAPDAEYPHPWSVRRWITGTTPDRDPQLDPVVLAEDLGLFLRELRSAPTMEGPVAGAHSFYRGTHPSVYGERVQWALEQLADRVDVKACQEIWNEAVRTAWPADPVWFHGDLAPGNLLTDRGRLVAVMTSAPAEWATPHGTW